MTALKIKAVIFDLDGLVLDSETTYITAWRQAALDMGCALDDAFCRSLSGMHGGAVMGRMKEFCGSGFDIDRFSRTSAEIWTTQVSRQGIPVKTGFFTALNTLRRLDLPFALATNSRRHDAQFCLEAAGLGGVFPIFVSRDDVPNGKPAPDIFIAAASALGIEPGDCLVLEDSPVGVAGARAAGSPCIYVPSIYPADDEAALTATAMLEDLEQAAVWIDAARNKAIP